MSRQSWAKWTLPVVINPPRHICYVVKVPRERFHIAAFLGAMNNLASAIFWQDDPAHKAREVALVWRDIVDFLEKQECTSVQGDNLGDIEDAGMRLRIDPDNDCIIQCLDECSGEWGTFIDVAACAQLSVGQQDPGGDQSVGTTNCYDVHLPGNSQWISPVSVQDGDTIVISAAGGGWFDGAGWYCPNGNGYALGACAGAPHTDGSDPNPAINHGRLIASIDDGASWDDGYNTAVDILPGTEPTNLLIQMNDSSLADNGGSVHFRVCITRANPETWEYDIDFTLNSGGWQPRTTGSSEYVLGTGWRNTAALEASYIKFVLTNPAVLTFASATFVSSVGSDASNGCAIFHNDPGTPIDILRDNSLATSPGGTLEGDVDVTIPTSDTLAMGVNNINALGTAGALVITAAHFEGTGPNPFI